MTNQPLHSLYPKHCSLLSIRERPLCARCCGVSDIGQEHCFWGEAAPIGKLTLLFTHWVNLSKLLNSSESLCPYL